MVGPLPSPTRVHRAPRRACGDVIVSPRRETGAYDVLSGLKTFTKTKGLRLSDLMKVCHYLLLAGRLSLSFRARAARRAARSAQHRNVAAVNL